MRNAALVCLMGLAGATAKTQSMVWTREQEVAAGVDKHHVTTALPQEYVQTASLPTNFTWGNVNGVSYLTKSLNQHIPQYCGSCWAHGAISALGDRIKIARKAQGVDINLAVQHVLNCGNAGSCHGGSAGGVYNWISSNGYVVYDTCNPYLACSSESQEGFCPDISTKCTSENICRTCSTFTSAGGFCAAIGKFPNATVSQHGAVSGNDNMMKEIYARGPIACGVDAEPMHNYHGGILEASCGGINHIISVVGWGEENGSPYWIVRNSWGEFWGEMGYVRLSRKEGKGACVNQGCNWAVPGSWTVHNYPCDEDGHNCKVAAQTNTWVDPSVSKVALGRRV